MTQKERIIQLKNQGMKNSEIATTIGCSVGNVNTTVWKEGLSRSKALSYTDEDCIYVNLRKWMNENNISKRSLHNRIFGYCENANYTSEILRGKIEPRKKTIDKMLKATGMTYEVLFEVSANENE